MRLLFVLFILIPVLEMWILIKVGERIGALLTILLVLATAAIGITLLRWQGMDTFVRANQRMQKGDLPTQELAEGLLLAIGGALLLTPGFVTDAVGFSCLLPMTRRVWVKNMFRHGRWQAVHSTTERHSAASNDTVEKQQSVIIEGEYQREDD